MSVLDSTENRKCLFSLPKSQRKLYCALDTFYKLTYALHLCSSQMLFVSLVSCFLWILNVILLLFKLHYFGSKLNFASIEIWSFYFYFAFYSYLFLYFWEKVASSPGSPAIPHVTEDDLEQQTLLSLPPQGWVTFTGEDRRAWFIQCWAAKAGLDAHQAGIPPTELHPIPFLHILYLLYWLN